MFRRPTDRTIIPQYTPPAGLSLLAAAELLGEGKRAIAAQIMQFAVSKAITITPALPGRQSNSGFTLTLRSLDGLGPDEMDTMQALFPRGVVGERIAVRPGSNRALSRRLRMPHGRAVARLVMAGWARERGFFERTFSRATAQPIVPLPPSAEMVGYLWGIHDYIALAEKDRLAFLQSPQGALMRTDISIDVQTLVLNEKLLPYAVLFGLEDEWMRELGVSYEGLTRDDLDALEVLGGIASFALSGVELIPFLMFLGDVVKILFGVGKIVGGIVIFFATLGN
jgi:hypothetical protein